MSRNGPDDDLIARVRELRATGSSPKEIARALDVRPSVVARIVRELGAHQVATRGEPEVVGCCIATPGESIALPAR